MITIITWVLGIIFAFYVIRVTFAILVAITEVAYDAIRIRNRKKRENRKAFENYQTDEYKPAFKFRYLLPRKK